MLFKRNKKKYDVGVYGLWYGENYGSIITYYALNYVLKEFGYKTLMINNPLRREGENIKLLRKSHPLRFADKYYDVSELYPIDRMKELNDLCDKFVIGSDQMWNYNLSRPYKQSYFLDFVDNRKTKISYATSFGVYPYNGPNSEKQLIRKNLESFNAISVRDDFSKKIIEEEIGYETQQVLDPVFLCPKEAYYQLSENSSVRNEKDFIFAYILDPNEIIGEQLKKIADESGKKLTIIFNEQGNKQEFMDRLKIDDSRITYLSDPTVNDWISMFINSDFVVSDSFHGLCFSLIFQKKFAVLCNKNRGGNRFYSLLNSFSFKNDNNLIEDANDFYEAYIYNRDNELDFSSVDSSISKQREESREWLKKSLEETNLKVKKTPAHEKPFKAETLPDDVKKLYDNPEFKKIRVLATLLKDYGIKHVVLSPGGRDVPLVRMFEYNDNYFILHRVTDERSAAYYGLGLAAQTRKPVVCVCTSGTAASNYLPAVTEAYYTGIPLIMVTADRYSVYHEQGEDQTIPQSRIYEGVIKKSITLPEGNGYKEDYQTRRDISDCILECTHNVHGPVHINIAIGDNTMGSKVGRENWKLLPTIYPHIQRISLNDTPERLSLWVNELKKANKILIVYGQNPPLSKEEKANIEKFASRYNCLIVTDHISNFHSSISMSPHNMLEKIDRETFNNTLSPDILITVGGKRLMNDPLTAKIRSGKKEVRHWHVSPDGRIKDFYFRLTTVIEMTQDSFFRWFADNANGSKNNHQYFNTWKKLNDQYPSPKPTTFANNYIQSKLLPLIPDGSILHLGVGQTFYDCRRFNISEGVEVFCNMGTNGIDGCTSTFLGQCEVSKNRLCFLVVGDLSFFYDMNSIWNKPLHNNIRILLINNNGTSLLKGHNLKGITSVHNTSAKGWVESTGFKYISADSKESFENKLKVFLKRDQDAPIFFEVFCE